MVNRPTAEDDDWLRQPLCQLDIFEGVTSPVCNGSGDVPPAAPPRSSVTTSVFPRRMVDSGTHEDGDLEPHCRVRRYLLHPPMHRLQVIDCEDSNQVVTHKEAAFTIRHNPTRPRRVSDCTTCTPTSWDFIKVYQPNKSVYKCQVCLHATKHYVTHTANGQGHHCKLQVALHKCTITKV